MGGTLLLADDSITIQKVVELTFAETEHKVVAVGNGRDLFARLSEVKPDVVLCDVVMPDINGYEVCQTLKSDPNTLHLPVVLLTGTFEPFDRDRALAAGCDAIVTKPFEARELINVVEDLLRRAQSVAAIPMPSEAGDQGIPEGVPALEFSTTGFEQLAARIQPPPPIPEDGIELTASSLGDSSPKAPIPAPPELAEPAISTAVSAISQSFAFGGDEVQAPAPAPMTEAFAAEPPAPAPEIPPLTTEPPAFEPEPPALIPTPPAPAPAAEPFPVGKHATETAHDLFAPEPEPAPAQEVERPGIPVFPAEAEPIHKEMPTQRLRIPPTPVAPPPAEPPAPAPVAEKVAAAAPALAVGALSAEVVEQVMRRVKEMIPPSQPAPPPPTAADLLTGEHVERIARRAAELVPRPPAPPTAAEIFTDEHVERVARRAAELVPPPPPPPTAAEILTDDHVERVAKRAAELVPPPESRSAELSDAQIDKIAKRVVELAAPQLERIAWEVIPDMAEMLVRKRIEDLEKAAEEES
ncbi:MAG TPA: response regulator [Thermoanaerobaculaceae bacterium]|nr:response regulator [Thermoanaerobaculaceae bacterium]